MYDLTTFCDRCNLNMQVMSVKSDDPDYVVFVTRCTSCGAAVTFGLRTIYSKKTLLDETKVLDERSAN